MSTDKPIVPQPDPAEPADEEKSITLSRKKREIIPLSKMVELANRGMNDTEIAKLLGCDRSNVTHRLSKVSDNIPAMRDYKETRADKFADLQRRILDTFTDEDLSNAKIKERSILLAILYDKERLERGASTQNIEQISKIVHTLDKRLRVKQPQDVVDDTDHNDSDD